MNNKPEEKMQHIKEIFYISTKSSEVQKILNFIRNHSLDEYTVLQNSNFKFKKSLNRDEIFIPIIILNQNEQPIQDPNTDEIMKKLKERNLVLKKIVKLTPEKSEYREVKSTNLREVLSKSLPNELISLVSRSYDLIGDIIILEIDPMNEFDSLISSLDSIKLNRQQFLEQVGACALSLNKGIKTVLNKHSKVKGEFRIREYKRIAGESKTTTRHHENDCLFDLDIAEMFFTPRLVFERKRVSELSYDNRKLILDCFAGVGPYSIQIAAKNNVEILSCEKNPAAVSFLKKNIKLNKKRLLGKISPILEDFKDLKNSKEAVKFIDKTDVIIMNLPERNLEFIPNILPFVRKEGTLLIIYLFESGSDSLILGIEELKKELKNNNLILDHIEFSRIVKNFSPQMETIVLDAIIKKES